MGLLAVDIVVAFVLAGVGITELRSVGDDIFYRAADGLGVVLVLAQTLPLALRRFYPVAVTVVICLAGSVTLWLDFPGTNALLAVPLALYSVAALRPRRTTIAVVIGALVLLVPPLAITQQNTLTFLVVAVVVFVVGAFAGDGVRARRLYAEALELRAEQAEHERELEAREAVIQERTRIARELHDAVGHTVNVMVMQAGAGRLASATDPAKSVEAHLDDTFVAPPGKFLVRVAIPEGYMNATHKAEVQRWVTESITAVVPSPDAAAGEAPRSVMVILEEVTEGNWAAGGVPISLTHIADVVGLPKDGDRYRWVLDYFGAKARAYAAAGYPDDTGTLLPPAVPG